MKIAGFDPLYSGEYEPKIRLLIRKKAEILNTFSQFLNCAQCARSKRGLSYVNSFYIGEKRFSPKYEHLFFIIWTKH